jgi:hypothetical protein
VIFDFDQHLFEYPDMWMDYCDPDKKHLALEMTRDELGYPWLWSRATNQMMWIYAKTVPEDGFVSFFSPWQNWKDRKPAEIDYVADMPASCTQAKARVQQLDELGVDKTILFPHFGAVWGRYIYDRLDIIRANLSAWNRWAVAVRQEGAGRLEPAGHVTLRGGDLGWLERELATWATMESNRRWSPTDWSTAGGCPTRTMTGRGRRSSTTALCRSSTSRMPMCGRVGWRRAGSSTPATRCSRPWT